MRTKLAVLNGPAAATLAALLLLSLASYGARGADSWQPLYGPNQNGGAMALDNLRHRLIIFGGDGTDLVRVLPLDGYPYSWGTLSAEGSPPAIRHGHALVFDAANDRVVVFGGKGLNGELLNDVWQLTLGESPVWTQLSPVGTAPDPRHDFGACYDDASGMLFVFGGSDAEDSALPNDLFALDLNANPPAWSQPAQSGDLPVGRFGSPLALDATGRRLLLFGGNEGFYDLDDLYELDLGTFEWSAVPTSGIVPEPRHDHLCAFDGNSRQLLVWGGTAADDSLRALDLDTRQWSSLNWFIGPPAHEGRPSIGVFDWQWNRLVVLAGQRGAEVWTFWKSNPTNFWYWTGPASYTFGGSMVVDHAHARAITYGGTEWPGQGARSEFWQFSFADPTGWNGVNTGGIAPPARTGHLAVWDDHHDRMLVFAGREDVLVPTNTVYALQDSADFMNWQALQPTGTPPSPRTYTTGIYDPEGDRMLVFGGLDGSGFLGGLHQLSLSGAPAWSTLSPTGGPSARAGATAIYDAPRRRMILFGGDDNNYLNDVWALNLPALTWTQLAPTGTPPEGRWKHNAVYDERRGRMVVFGGRVASADSADSWALDLSTSTPSWTRLTPTGYLPPFRSDAGAAYDFTNDRMLVYGGVSLYFTNLAVGQQDLWALQFGSTTVSAVISTDGPSASAPSLRLSVSPNPFNGRALFELAAPEGRAVATASLALYDLRGCRVAQLFAGTLVGGQSRVFSWEGYDDEGRPVGSGTYLARAVVGSRTATTRISIVR